MAWFRPRTTIIKCVNVIILKIEKYLNVFSCKIIAMTICKCNIIYPKGIHLLYKDVSMLVPTPLFIKKLKVKTTTNDYPRLTRDRFENLNERFNYNKRKFVTYNDIFLKQHKQKMQETFYIIKKLTPHNKKKNKCNNRVYEIQYDKNGQYGIVINFEKPQNEYDIDDDVTLNENPESNYKNNSNSIEETEDEECEFNFSYDDYINIGDDDGMYDDTFGYNYDTEELTDLELSDLEKELMDLK